MKRYLVWLWAGALVACAPVREEGATVDEPVAEVMEEPLSAREAVLAVARELVGTREATGRNDGPVIEAMQRAVGIRAPGDPYCAAFNYWCYLQAGRGAEVPRSGWSPDWVRAPTWTAAAGGRLPEGGDAFGIWFASKKRVAHTGLIERWEGASAVTIEANTGRSAEFASAGDRDGDGVWRKRRLVRQIYSVRAWLPHSPVSEGTGEGSTQRK